LPSKSSTNLCLTGLGLVRQVKRLHWAIFAPVANHFGVFNPESIQHLSKVRSANVQPPRHPVNHPTIWVATSFVVQLYKPHFTLTFSHSNLVTFSAILSVMIAFTDKSKRYTRTNWHCESAYSLP